MVDDLEEQHPHEDGLTATTILEVVPELVTMPSRFESVQKKGNLDVWWLYDDGGEYVCLSAM